MRRPYRVVIVGDEYDAVDVVGHDYEGVDLGVGVVIGDGGPTVGCDAAGFVWMHFVASD